MYNDSKISNPQMAVTPKSNQTESNPINLQVVPTEKPGRASNTSFDLEGLLGIPSFHKDLVQVSQQDVNSIFIELEQLHRLIQHPEKQFLSTDQIGAVIHQVLETKIDDKPLSLAVELARKVSCDLQILLMERATNQFANRSVQLQSSLNITQNEHKNTEIQALKMRLAAFEEQLQANLLTALQKHKLGATENDKMTVDDLLDLFFGKLAELTEASKKLEEQKQNSLAEIKELNSKVLKNDVLAIESRAREIALEDQIKVLQKKIEQGGNARNYSEGNKQS